MWYILNNLINENRINIPILLRIKGRRRPAPMLLVEILVKCGVSGEEVAEIVNTSVS